MTTLRDAHWRDDPHPTLPGKRTRTIRNWIHFRQPGGDWQETAPGLAAMDAPPHDWTGAWDFSRGSQRAALQVWARDAMDAGNRALVGVRASERPQDWVNFKALNIAAPVDAQWSADGSTVTWPGLWTHADLKYTVGPDRIKEDILLDAPGHAFRWGFTVKLPPGYSIALTPDGGAAICDGDGIERLKVRAPTGHDSATTAPTPDGRQSIRCWLEIEDVRPFPILWTCADEADFAGAVYPCAVDPTTVISGTTDTEDNLIDAGNTANNHGASTSLQGPLALNPANLRRLLVRVASTALPAGSVSAAAWSVYVTGGGTNAGTISSHAVLRQWVEGTANGSAQNGSSCWSHYVYNTAAWTTAGCAGDGSDYESAASPPTTTLPAFSSATWLNIAWTPSWVERWKAGTLENNGVRMSTAYVAANYIIHNSSEAASNKPYLTVVYTPAVTSHPYYYHFLTRRRRG